MNKLSDDLNFNMDHAREGMAKARHHLEQHLAMCESLEENFNTFKLNLKDVVIKNPCQPTKMIWHISL